MIRPCAIPRCPSPTRWSRASAWHRSGRPTHQSAESASARSLRGFEASHLRHALKSMTGPSALHLLTGLFLVECISKVDCEGSVFQTCVASFESVPDCKSLVATRAFASTENRIQNTDSPMRTFLQQLLDREYYPARSCRHSERSTFPIDLNTSPWFM